MEATHVPSSLTLAVMIVSSARVTIIECPKSPVPLSSSEFTKIGYIEGSGTLVGKENPPYY
jgi:hypothetical protein